MSKHWDPTQSGRTGQWHRWPVRRPQRRRRLRHWHGNLLMLVTVYAAVALYDFADPPVADGALPSQRSGESLSPTAVRVIDGDTFDYGGMRIRIADIDTPEVNGRCAYESELAARATARLAALMSGGFVEMHPLPDGRDADRYGRKLRIVTRGGQSVGDVLIAEALARSWTERWEPSRV